MSSHPSRQPTGDARGRWAVAAAGLYAGAAATVALAVVLTRFGTPTQTAVAANVDSPPAALADAEPAPPPSAATQPASGLIPEAWTVVGATKDATADQCDPPAGSSEDRPGGADVEPAPATPPSPPGHPTRPTHPERHVQAPPTRGPVHFVRELHRVPEIGLHTFGASTGDLRFALGLRHP